MFLDFQINMIVKDVEPCVSFYKAIGFEETYRTPAEGAAEHVEVRALGLTLGIASVAAAREVHGIHTSVEGNAVQVCLWCDDVDAAFAKMLQAGARAVREPRDFQGGRLRTGWALDPANNLIEVVQQRG
ncbi:MAG TPA: VOC family protein [Ktedonobacterales bacterium]|nr:VOC family protein [Ktedonobacterales bacterium]